MRVCSTLYTAHSKFLMKTIEHWTLIRLFISFSFSLQFIVFGVHNSNSNIISDTFISET